MAVFEYKALQANGSVKMGKVDAGGRSEALSMVEALGLTPLKLSEVGGTGVVAAAKSNAPKTSTAMDKLGLNFQSKKVSFTALEDFTRSLSSLLTAGVPLSRALTILYKECSNPVAGEKWKELYDMVVDGVSLAEAMSRSPGTFPRVYVAMVEAGEAGGFLDVVLGQIADFQSREKELRAKVMAAMMYPAVLLTLAIGVVIFLLVFFIPRFQTLFAGFDAALPMITQIIVGISDALRHYGLFLLGGIIVAIYFGRTWAASDKGRRSYENILLRTPVVGPLMAQIAMARFCRMLGTLLGAGVSLMSGLNVARRSLGYQTLIDMITDSTERVKKGESLAGALGNCRQIFTGSTLEMVSVAEESGRLDQELVRLATSTELNLDRQLKTAVSLAEPLLLFVIAGFIGTIFIGMVLPIFSIQDSIK
jgi:type II secretory pathway component PulF